MQEEKRLSPTNDTLAVYFNASVEELKWAGESFENIAELNGGGYPASLGAYHQLHCVVSFSFFFTFIGSDRLT